MKRMISTIVAAALCISVASFAFAAGGQEAAGVDAKANLEASLKVDTSGLKSADGQLLLRPSTDNRPVPKRPANPDALPETDPLHWYDMEWAGWNANKAAVPKTPMTGAIGKKIIFIVHG
ncbi:MAG: hypothetical protein ABIJ86_12150, partial [Spirochaetota bacterium]